MTDQAHNNQESFCTFNIDDLLFGVEVKEVQEVIRTQQSTRVPLAPSVVSGLMNLRGQIVSTLNLRQRLGIDGEMVDKPMNVVIRSADGPISLLVDEIGDVVEVDRDRFEPPPETLQGPQRDLMRGAFKLDGRLLLILDTEKVFKIAA